MRSSVHGSTTLAAQFTPFGNGRPSSICGLIAAAAKPPKPRRNAFEHAAGAQIRVGARRIAQAVADAVHVLPVHLFARDDRRALRHLDDRRVGLGARARHVGRDALYGADTCLASPVNDDRREQRASAAGSPASRASCAEATTGIAVAQASAAAQPVRATTPRAATEILAVHGGRCVIDSSRVIRKAETDVGGYAAPSSRKTGRSCNGDLD